MTSTRLFAFKFARVAFSGAVLLTVLWTASAAQAEMFGRGGGFGRSFGGGMRMQKPVMGTHAMGMGQRLNSYRLTPNRMFRRHVLDNEFGRRSLNGRLTRYDRLKLYKDRHASRIPPKGGAHVPPTEGTHPKPPHPGKRWPRPPKFPPVVIGVPPVIAIPPVDPGGPSGPGYTPPTLVSSGPTGPSGPSGPPGLPPGGGGNAPPAGPVAFAPSVTDSRYVPDEILVSFPANVAQQTVISFAQSQRLALLGIHQLDLVNTRLYRFRITDGRQVPAVVQSLGSDARIAAVQPNYLYALQSETSAIPAGDPSQYVLDRLKLREAHTVSTGANVLVAVIDSGIDAQHPELANAVASSFDSARSTAPLDAHGTEMASAIAAHANLLGIAPAARLLSVRAFDGAVGSAQSTTVRLLEGMQWAANSGARVVNMSFTGPADPRLHQMIAATRARGVVLVAAAGNNGPRAPAAFPAAYPEVIAVTATDQSDGVFARANRGSYIALAAPGVDIFVAIPNGGYKLTTGTSVAAAHVSGLVALVLARSPDLTPDAVRAILLASARDLGPAGRDDLYGAGLVDAAGALNQLAPKLASQPLQN